MKESNRAGLVLKVRGLARLDEASRRELFKGSLERAWKSPAAKVIGDRGQKESKSTDQGSHVTRRLGFPLGAVGNERRFQRAGSGPRRPSPGKKR